MHGTIPLPKIECKSIDVTDVKAGSHDVADLGAGGECDNTKSRENATG